MPITALPTPPLRSDGPLTFADRGDVFMAALPAVVTQANALEANVDALEASATTAASTATTQAGIATTAASAAASASGAAAWVSGTSYALGAAVWSPANRIIYRRIVAGAGTTDPSLDATNWAVVGTLGLAVVTVSGTSQTAVAGIHYVLTNASATTVTLPAGAEGATVAVTTTGTLTTNVIARNGANTIMEVAENMTLDKAAVTVTLRFLSNSWRVL